MVVVAQSHRRLLRMPLVGCRGLARKLQIITRDHHTCLILMSLSAAATFDDISWRQVQPDRQQWCLDFSVGHGISLKLPVGPGIVV